MIADLTPEGIPAQPDTIVAEHQMTPVAATDDPAQQQQSVAAPQEQAPQTDKELNFRAMRQAAERAARERDELRQKLQQYENSRTAPVVDSSSEDFDIKFKDDDLVEGKQLNMMAAEIKKLKAQQRDFQKHTYESNAETRIRSQYPDFDRVTTHENLKMLSEVYPELAKSINSSNDLYDKAVSAYTLIKKFGIYEEHPYSAEKDRALANTAKPKPLASISPQQGDTPLSRANAFANGLTDDLKRTLRAEMSAASKRYGSNP